MAEPPTPRRKISRLRRLCYMAVTLVVLVVVLEAILQLLCLVSPRVNVMLTTSDRYGLLPDEQLGHRPNPDHPEHDAKGFRNAAVPDTAAVVAMGDSQTYGTSVTRDEAWPQQLAQLGGISTYNMAYGGWGPTQSLALLDEALALKPGVVVEAVYSGNDLLDCYRMVYERGQFPQFKSSDAQVLADLADAHKNDSSRFGRNTGVELFLSRYSRLYGLASAVKRNLQKAMGGSVGRADDASDLTITAGDNHTVLTPRYRLRAVNQLDARVRQGQRIALAALAAMADQTRAAGHRFLVLCIPTKELVFAEVSQQGDNQVSEMYADVIKFELQMWAQLQQDLNDRKIAYVDALPALRRVLEDGQNPYQITDDGHPSPAGQRAIAQTVLAELQKRGWVTNPAPDAPAP